MTADLVARDELARTAGQQREDLERLRSEMDASSLEAQLAALFVELERAEATDPHRPRILARASRQSASLTCSFRSRSRLTSNWVARRAGDAQCRRRRRHEAIRV